MAALLHGWTCKSRVCCACLSVTYTYIFIIITVASPSPGRGSLESHNRSIHYHNALPFSSSTFASVQTLNPVHSLMLSLQDLLWRPLHCPLSTTVHLIINLERVARRVTRPHQASQLSQVVLHDSHVCQKLYNARISTLSRNSLRVGRFLRNATRNWWRVSRRWALSPHFPMTLLPLVAN